MSKNVDIEAQLDQLLETATEVTGEISRQGSAMSDLQKEGAVIADIGHNSLEVARHMTSRRYRLWYWLRDTVQALFGGEEDRGEGKGKGKEKGEGKGKGKADEKGEKKKREGMDGNSIKNPLEERLNYLREISLGIGHELDQQNDTLDNIAEQTTSTETCLNRVQTKTKPLL